MDVPNEMQDVAAYFEDWDSAHRSGRLDDCGADFDDEFCALANEAKVASRKLVMICQALFARVSPASRSWRKRHASIRTTSIVSPKLSSDCDAQREFW